MENKTKPKQPNNSWTVGPEAKLLRHQRTFTAQESEIYTSCSISKASASHATPVTPTPASTCEKARAKQQIGQSIFF